MEMAELGAGGGQGDLDPQHELEFFDPALFAKLIELCETKLKEQPQLLSKVRNLLLSMVQAGADSLRLDISALDPGTDGLQPNSTDDKLFENLTIESFLPLMDKLLASAAPSADGVAAQDGEQPVTRPPAPSAGLSKQITFPYSRHASYHELRLIIEAFKPKDIFPCTVSSRWHPSHSMAALFGDLYDHEVLFRHDAEMMEKHDAELDQVRLRMANKRQMSSSPQAEETQRSPSPKVRRFEGANVHDEEVRELIEDEVLAMRPQPIRTQSDDDETDEEEEEVRELTEAEVKMARREEAEAAALGIDGRNWRDIGLVSVNGHQEKEVEM